MWLPQIRRKILDFSIKRFKARVVKFVTDTSTRLQQHCSHIYYYSSVTIILRWKFCKNSPFLYFSEYFTLLHFSPLSITLYICHNAKAWSACQASHKANMKGLVEGTRCKQSLHVWIPVQRRHWLVA